MSDLDNAMLEHIAFLVLSEKKPFSFNDFLYFRVDERDYGMTHGTFRNKISKLIKENKVEWYYTSGCAFYTLKGYNFRKPMTPNPMVVLKFKLPNIWKIFSLNPISQKRN